MIYTGQTQDGVFMRPAEPMYMHPDGTIWGSEPFTSEQARMSRNIRKENRIIDMLVNKYGIVNNSKRREELKRVKNKTSKLPRYLRDYLLTNK